MSKPVVEWTEDDVLSLPRDENDTFERKGAKLLDLTLPQVNEGDVLNELAKQLSAFANCGGGQIIYGLDDGGGVDNGGVARSLRGRQSTKEWLENRISTLTDFEIVGVNVYEILPKQSGSSLDQNKSLYVVDVPDSDRAPHQSKRDLKYYVRLGGRSEPASHRLIEDIRNRATHPLLEVHDVRITSANIIQPSTCVGGLRSEFRLMMGFRYFGLRNAGKVQAANSCLQLSGTIPLDAVQLVSHDHAFRSAAEGTTLIELKNPLYPGMGIILAPTITVSAQLEVLPKSEQLTLAGVSFKDATLVIRMFADNAPVRKQEFMISELDPDKHLVRAINQEVRRIRSGEGQSGPPHVGVWS